MTAPVLQTVIDNLDAAARSASVAEEKFRREVVERIAALERARAFAFRRLNFVKAIVAAPRIIHPRSHKPMPPFSGKPAGMVRAPRNAR
jgi:hypothetical protein